jgi:hypothetical protein
MDTSSGVQVYLIQITRDTEFNEKEDIDEESFEDSYGQQIEDVIKEIRECAMGSDGTSFYKDENDQVVIFMSASRANEFAKEVWPQVRDDINQYWRLASDEGNGDAGMNTDDDEMPCPGDGISYQRTCTYYVDPFGGDEYENKIISTLSLEVVDGGVIVDFHEY